MKSGRRGGSALCRSRGGGLASGLAGRAEQEGRNNDTGPRRYAEEEAVNGGERGGRERSRRKEVPGGRSVEGRRAHMKLTALLMETAWT